MPVIGVDNEINIGRVDTFDSAVQAIPILDKSRELANTDDCLAIDSWLR